MKDAVEDLAVNLTYLMEQGARGSHILFKNDEIRHAFANRDRLPSLDDASPERLKEAVRSLALLPSTGKQRDVIEQMPERQRDLLILFYFHFLDEFVRDRARTTH